jgi:hypothetical protein
MALATLKVVSAYEAIEDVSVTSLPEVARGSFDLVCRSIFTSLLCLDEFGAAVWPEVKRASIHPAGSSSAAGLSVVRLLRGPSLGDDGNGQR